VLSSRAPRSSLAEFAPAKRRGAGGFGRRNRVEHRHASSLPESGCWSSQLPHERALFLGLGAIPFLASVVIAAAAFLVRRNDEGDASLRAAARAARTTNGGHPRQGHAPRSGAANAAFFTMLGLRIGENGPSYLAQGFLVGYVAKVLLVNCFGTDRPRWLVASCLGFAVISALRLAFRPVRTTHPPTAGFCILLVAYAFPAFALLDSREPRGRDGHHRYWNVHRLARHLRCPGPHTVSSLFSVPRTDSPRWHSPRKLGSILSGGTAAPPWHRLFLAAFRHVVGRWPLYWVLMAGIGLFTTFVAPENTRSRILKPDPRRQPMTCPL